MKMLYRGIAAAWLCWLTAASLSADVFSIDPYVTRVDARSAVILWVGPPAGEPGSVVIRPLAGGPAHRVPSRMTRPPFLDREVPGLERADVRHTARIDGLEPFTAYEYRVYGPDEEGFREGSFKTAPEPGRTVAFRFSVLSDTHGRNDAVSEAVAADRPHFVVHTGDLTGGFGNHWQSWLAYFDSARPYLRSSVFWPVVGNHDVRPPDNFRALFGFDDPELDDPEGGFPRAHVTSYYTFTFGNLRYIVLDAYGYISSNNPAIEPAQERADQFEWLERVLQANTSEWTLVSLHCPPFAVGSRGGMRRHTDYVELFERYGVDLVIYGHNHIYERLLPIGPADGKPVHYICTNAGGYRNRVVRPSPIVVGGIGRRLWCHATFWIDGNRLRMEAKTPDGTVFDRLELVKTAGLYQPEIMQQAVETERAREIAFAFAAQGTVGNFRERQDMPLNLPELPQPGKPLAAVLDVDMLPRDSRLHIESVNGPADWRVEPQILTIGADHPEIHITPPAKLNFDAGTLQPPLELLLTLEVDGRLYEPAVVQPTMTWPTAEQEL